MSVYIQCDIQPQPRRVLNCCKVDASFIKVIGDEILKAELVPRRANEKLPVETDREQTKDNLDINLPISKRECKERGQTVNLSLK
jgi:hypothetical protein